MSDDLAQAAREAVEASDNSEQLRLILAMLHAQQLTQAAQPQPSHAPAPRQQFNAVKWLVIGGTAALLALAFALSMIAVAILGVCATACLLVLRSLWREILRGRD
ncbi:hypothetical protein [Streptomyces sp. NEAU-NA10]|uniref:hypothetical protein n=1 Tax=Streptomyces sp. NEAU-NA10 TaxID=3416050 RepID=UPI003CC68936